MLNFVSLTIFARFTSVGVEKIEITISRFNRHVIFYSYLESLKLGGKDNIVEIDESECGKRKYNRGHRVEGVRVYGAIERSTRRILIMFVECKLKPFSCL